MMFRRGMQPSTRKSISTVSSSRSALVCTVYASAYLRGMSLSWVTLFATAFSPGPFSSCMTDVMQLYQTHGREQPCPLRPLHPDRLLARKCACGQGKHALVSLDAGRGSDSSAS